LTATTAGVEERQVPRVVDPVEGGEALYPRQYETSSVGQAWSERGTVNPEVIVSIPAKN